MDEDYKDIDADDDGEQEDDNKEGDEDYEDIEADDDGEQEEDNKKVDEDYKDIESDDDGEQEDDNKEGDEDYEDIEADDDCFPLDESMFFDEVDELDDLSYYRDNPKGKGRTGRKPNPGGPDPPNLEGMDEEQAATAMKLHLKARKTFHDSNLHKQSRLSVGGNDDAQDDVMEYTGDCTDKLRMMTEVESSRMMEGHTYPSQEIVRLRLAEEANLCECFIRILKSDARKVIATGIKNDNSFCIKVLYSKSKSWTVIKCDTHRIPLPKYEAGLASVGLGGEEGTVDADVGNKGNICCNINSFISFVLSCLIETLFSFLFLFCSNKN